MEVLAVIPARGGSKGILKKNLAPFGGRPLITWMIDAALKAESIDRVVVSSDDEEILHVALDAGAERFVRTWEFATDEASSESVVLDVLDRLLNYQRYVPDVTVLLQCTSPLTLPEDIDGTLEALQAPAGDHGTISYSSALSVTPFDKFLWWDMGVNKGVTGIQHDKGARREMRQERHVQFMENGAVYAMRTSAFLKEKTRFCGFTNTHVMPKERSIEIDEPHDLPVGEALLGLFVPA